MEVSLKTAATRRIRVPEVEGKHPPLPALVCVCVCSGVCLGGARLMLVRLAWNAGKFGALPPRPCPLDDGCWL